MIVRAFPNLAQLDRGDEEHPADLKKVTAAVLMDLRTHRGSGTLTEGRARRVYDHGREGRKLRRRRPRTTIALMVASALPLDPTPKSVEEILARLPAHDRAELAWFPLQLRATLVEPLRTADAGRWRAVLDEATPGAVRALFRFARSIAPLMRDPALAAALPAAGEAQDLERHERIAARLEVMDVKASDQLREAYEWLRAVVVTFLDELPEGEVHEISDADLQEELRGSGGSLLRGMLLTGAAIEVALDDRRMPAAIVEWCDLACREMNVAANYLRAQGLAIPAEVSIPGFTKEVWRARRRSLALEVFTPAMSKTGLPAGVIERIVEVLAPTQIWLFGSRARGTHGPDSDWDLLAVLPDDASDDKLDLVTVWRNLRHLRRMRVEVVPMRRSTFEEGREIEGHLAENVVREGRIVYGG